jgi:hypothetical protein
MDDNLEPRSQSKPWKNLLILAFLVGTGIAGYLLTQQGDNVSTKAVVEGQLRALKSQDITRAYYTFTSKSFRQRVSLDHFREDVASNKVLAENDGYKIKNELVNNDVAIVKASLTSKNGDTSPAIFHLEQENKKWKISSFKIGHAWDPDLIADDEDIADATTEKNDMPPEDNAIVAPIIHQLEDLKAHQISKAYADYTTKEFKERISLNDYTRFIDRFPQIANYYSVTVGELKKNETGVVAKINIETMDASYPMEYMLVDQEGWKIAGFHFLSPEKKVVKTSAEVSEVLKKVITEFVHQIDDGQEDNVYNSLMANGFKTVTSREEFGNFMKSYPEFKNHTGLTFGNSAVENDLYSQQVTFVTTMGESLIDFWLIDENGEWKIWGIHVEKSASYPPMDPEVKTQVVKVIEEQLKSLRDKDVPRAYYAFSSDEFERFTSLQDFKKFTAEFPILSQHEKMEVGQGVQEGKIQLVRIKLELDGRESEVDYRLVKEHSDWKVWNIKVVMSEKVSKQLLNRQATSKVISNQLTAILKNEYSEAYHAYTTKEFQENTSLDRFIEFIHDHPVLERNQSFTVKNLSIEGGRATVLVSIFAHPEGYEEYQFNLINNGTKWQIASIEAENNANDVVQ